MLYLSYFTSGPLYMFVILAVICFPVAVLKSAIACLQVTFVFIFIVKIEHKVIIFFCSRDTWPQLTLLESTRMKERRSRKSNGADQRITYLTSPKPKI